MKYVKASANLLLAILILLAVIFVAPKVIVIFTPFIIGWVIALIARPMVQFLETKLKIKRKIGGAFVIVLVIGIVVLGLYFLFAWLFREISGLISDFPRLWEAMQADLTSVAASLNLLTGKVPGGAELDFDGFIESTFTTLSKTINANADSIAKAAGDFALRLPTIFIGVVMALLSSYFFVADRNLVSEWSRKYLPVGVQMRYQMVKRSLSSSVGGYIKAQFKIEFWMYLILVLGLGLLRVDYFAVIALGIAILDIFPIFGTGTALIPWAIIKIINGDYKTAIWLLIIWAGGQLVRQFIQPKLLGDSMGVPTLPALFLLYAGYHVGGVWGMIFSLPIALVLYALYQEGAFDTTKKSIQILVAGMSRFRTITDEDMAEAEELSRRNRRMAEKLRSEEESSKQKQKNKN